MNKWLSTLIGIALSIAIIAVVVSKTDVTKSLSLIARVGWRLPAALVAIYLTTFPLRAVRWLAMLPPGTLTYSQALKGVVLGYAGNNLLPARGGEFLRMEFLHRAHAHIGRIAALSSIVVERILDGLVLLAVLAGSMAASTAVSEHHWLNRMMWIAGLIFGAAFVGVLLLRLWGTAVVRALSAFKSPLTTRLTSVVERTCVAVGFLGFNRRTATAIGLSFAIWLLEGSMFVLGCREFGIGEHSVAAGFFTLAVVNFGLLAPSTPGYLGLFQGMSILALRVFGADNDEGLAVGLFVHACQFIPVTVWGSALLLQRVAMASSRSES